MVTTAGVMGAATLSRGRGVCDYRLQSLITGTEWGSLYTASQPSVASLPPCCRHPLCQTPSTGLRHPSFGGRCRKAMFGVCLCV